MYHGERFNSSTHLMGTLPAAAGAAVLVVLDEKLRHGHGVWHLFVLAGGASHYLAILLYVA